MPWCAGCDRFLSPNTVLADGTCPTCHSMVPDAARIPDTDRAVASRVAPADPAANATDGAVDAAAEADDEHTPIPWHLWLLIAAVVVYLGYRAFQGLELLFGF
jgi:hypothetical protein